MRILGAEMGIAGETARHGLESREQVMEKFLEGKTGLEKHSQAEEGEQYEHKLFHRQLVPKHLDTEVLLNWVYLTNKTW